MLPCKIWKVFFGEGQFTFNGDGSSLSNLDIEGKVEDIVLQLSPMNKVTAKSFTIDSLARLEEKKFPVGESESKFNQINIINHGKTLPKSMLSLQKPGWIALKTKIISMSI